MRRAGRSSRRRRRPPRAHRRRGSPAAVALAWHECCRYIICICMHRRMPMLTTCRALMGSPIRPKCSRCPGENSCRRSSTAGCPPPGSPDAVVLAGRNRRWRRRVRGRRRAASLEPARIRARRLGAGADRQRGRLRRPYAAPCRRELHDNRNQGQFLPAHHPDMGTVRAEGRAVSRGRRIISCEARVVDAKDRLLAHGTSTLMVLADRADDRRLSEA